MTTTAQTKRAKTCEKKIMKLFDLRGEYDQLDVASISVALGYSVHTTRASLRYLTDGGKLVRSRPGRRMVFARKLKEPILPTPAPALPSLEPVLEEDSSDVADVIARFSSKRGTTTTTLHRAREVATWFFDRRALKSGELLIVSAIVAGFAKGEIDGVSRSQIKPWIVRRVAQILEERGDLLREVPPHGIRGNVIAYIWRPEVDGAKIEVDGVPVVAGVGFVARIDDALSSVAFLGQRNVNTMALDSVLELVHGTLPGLDFSAHSPDAVVDTRRLVAMCRSLLETFVHGASPNLSFGSQSDIFSAYIGGGESPSLVRPETRAKVFEWAKGCIDDIAKSRGHYDERSESRKEG